MANEKWSEWPVAGSVTNADGVPVLVGGVNKMATVAAILAALAAVPDASTTVKGLAQLSATPASAATPIAVADTDVGMGYARSLVRGGGLFGYSKVVNKDPGAATRDTRLSDGTDDSGTFRVRYTAMTGCADLRLVYFNAGNGGPVPNDVTIAGAGLEISGTTHRVTFGGANTKLMKPGDAVVSDPIRSSAYAIVSLAAGATFYTRTHYTVATGAKWQTEIFQLNSTRSEANNRGTGATDRSQATGTTNLTVTAGEYVPAPIAILADQITTADDKPSILMLGDSITSGLGDSAGGFAVRAIEAALLPHFRASLTAEQVFSHASANILRSCREPFYLGHKYAVVLYGTNDIDQSGRLLATIQANLQTFWRRVAARGIAVYACTLPPMTSSTDAWATSTNQTPNATAGESVRTQLNDWIRTVPAPLTGVFETADTVETNAAGGTTTVRNGGRWKAGYAYDRAHPNATGAAAMATAIDVTKFV